MVIGGTSAVAPLWAGLIALNNQQNGKSAGFIQPQIYAAKGAAAFNDIVSGNNGAFSAGPGWDACTGLGSPIATKLIALLGASSANKNKGGKKKPVRMRPAKKKSTRRRG
jgi:kumamolisin